jgi:hypothetical protein
VSDPYDDLADAVSSALDIDAIVALLENQA